MQLCSNRTLFTETDDGSDLAPRSTTDPHEGKRKATRGKSSSKGVEMGKNMENQKRANNVVFLLPGAQKEASVFTKDMCWHTGQAQDRVNSIHKYLLGAYYVPDII